MDIRRNAALRPAAITAPPLSCINISLLNIDSMGMSYMGTVRPRGGGGVKEPRRRDGIDIFGVGGRVFSPKR